MNKAEGSPRHFEVKSLHELAFYSCVNHARKHFDWKTASTLPSSIKQRFLRCFCNRNIINDDNVGYLLDRSTTEITVGGTVLSSKGLEKLLVCERLDHLDLSEKNHHANAINGTLNRLFQQLHRLTYVNLRSCARLANITVVNLARNCPYLKYLDVHGCWLVDDDALVALANSCHFIEALDLSRTNISNMGVRYLATSACNKTLKEFSVSCCGNVKYESVEFLLDKCPLIYILKCNFRKGHTFRDEDRLSNKQGKLIAFTVAI